MRSVLSSNHSTRGCGIATGRNEVADLFSQLAYTLHLVYNGTVLYNLLGYWPGTGRVFRPLPHLQLETREPHVACSFFVATFHWSLNCHDRSHLATDRKIGRASCRERV